MAGSSKLKPWNVGNSRNIRVTIKDKTTKAGIDISGDKFYFTVKDSAEQEDVDAVVQVSHTAPGDSNSAAGIVIISVPAASTVSVEPGDYVYDIVWLANVSSPGDRETIVEGNVNFQQSVTHAIS